VAVLKAAKLLEPRAHETRASVPCMYPQCRKGACIMDRKKRPNHRMGVLLAWQTCTSAEPHTSQTADEGSRQKARGTTFV
jgi:hypothetical protein